MLEYEKSTPPPSFTHYGSGTSSQKRQKIFDYTAECNSIAAKDAPKAEDLDSPADLDSFTKKPSTQ